jgi:hypothetical protein
VKDPEEEQVALIMAFGVVVWVLALYLLWPK